MDMNIAQDAAHEHGPQRELPHGIAAPGIDFLEPLPVNRLRRAGESGKGSSKSGPAEAGGGELFPRRCGSGSVFT